MTAIRPLDDRRFLETTPEVEGEIKIPLELFPKELAEQFLAMQGAPGPLTITIPEAFIVSGVNFDVGMAGSWIKFDFVAYKIEIKESK